MKQSKTDFILMRLNNFVEGAYKFLNECDGHPGVLLYSSVEAHIKEMWHLWHLLDGTWNEDYRCSESYLTKMCEKMRNKPIRTKGKIYPYKSGKTLNAQMNRIRHLAGNNVFFGETNPHYKKALEICERYGKNMSATKEWKEAFQKGYDERMRGSFDGYCIAPEATTAGYNMAYAVKFPKSVYAL